MGMLNALLDIGKAFVEDKIPKTGKIPRDVALECTTQMPMTEGTEIQIWLDVEDPAARPLNVLGVHRVTLADVDPRNKSRYLYRDTEGSNFSYCYSSVVRMQKKELNFDEAYLKKLETKVLKEFETPLTTPTESSASEGTFQVFQSGSIPRILTGLRQHRDELALLGKDALDAAKRDKKTASFLLVFGIRSGERFLYPGDTPVNALFSDYFWAKLGVVLSKGKEARCSLCGQEEKHAVNLNQVFAFATFDKESFLPGIRNMPGTPEKVFPLCRECLRWLSRGKDHGDTLFREDRMAYPLHLTVIPELFGSGPSMGRRPLERKTKDFLNTGLTNAPGLFEALLDQDDVLVYHFLFWEQIQAQERIHLMAEDVPPLRLTQLLHAWRRSCRMFPETQRPSATMSPEEKQSLSAGMRFVFGVLGSFAGKSKQDQTAMRDLALAVTGKLLQDEPVDLGLIKGIVCARLPGLLKDPNKPMKDRIPPVRRAERLVDFLARVNQEHFGQRGNHGEEEIDVQDETMRPEETADVLKTTPRKHVREAMEEMLKGFADPYLQEPFGQGVFLAGVVLGVFAREQVGKGGDLGSAPLFKQLNFGRLRRRDLQGQLGRLPGLVHQYRVPHAGAIQSLAGEVTRLLLEGTPKELGEEGNFAFAAGFLSATGYFWRCFGKTAPQEETADAMSPGEETPTNTEGEEENGENA